MANRRIINSHVRISREPNRSTPFWDAVDDRQIWLAIGTYAGHQLFTLFSAFLGLRPYVALCQVYFVLLRVDVECFSTLFKGNECVSPLSPGCPWVALKICEAQGVSPRRRFRTGSQRPSPQRLARASRDPLGHAPQKA